MSDGEAPSPTKRTDYRAALIGPDLSLSNAGRYAPQDFTNHRTQGTTLAPISNAGQTQDLRLSPLQQSAQSPGARKRSLSNTSQASAEPGEASGTRLQSISSLLNQPAVPMEPQLLQMSQDPAARRQQLLTRKRLLEAEKDRIDDLLKQCTEELLILDTPEQPPAPNQSHYRQALPERAKGNDDAYFENILPSPAPMTVD
ncbi:hypothetical protein ABW19_dt0200491 [Dactylella cylindrospora]|nr:hypothetical protein ABW19_dt0200491 [Dactylella cylindrospora]